MAEIKNPLLVAVCLIVDYLENNPPTFWQRQESIDHIKEVLTEAITKDQGEIN